MSRPPFQIYPSHHPHHGRPFIVVHDHDVLSGRGVNIAQHPGNERFRSLINTRQDAAYCATFTTSEKRALAEEIIAHIRSLDPPGRFLKRTGRSQSSRGLNGPWEELGHRECIKKTCQALRDCNRQDRQGYASQVSAPTDVKENAEERAKTGLSLKEHAAAAVAKANPSTLNPHHYNLNPPIMDRVYSTPVSESHTFSQQKRHSNDISTAGDRLSPSVEHAAHWLKKQRTDGPPPPTFVEGCTTDPNEPVGPAPADPVLSSMSRQVHSTPAPLVAPVPVSTTPPSAHSHQGSGHLTHVYHHQDHLAAVTHHTSSPQIPSPATYHHHHPDTTAPAPYSPVVLLNEDPGVDPSSGIDPHQPLDAYTTHHHHHHDPAQQFSDHHHHHAFNPSHEDVTGAVHPTTDDVLDAGGGHPQVGSLGEDPHDHHHHRHNSLSLINGDDGTHGSLIISDL